MKKYLGYIPAILFLALYLFSWLTGASMMFSMILIWLGCFLLAAVLLHKRIAWGGVFGAFPALHMIYRGDVEILIGVALLLFYILLGFISGRIGRRMSLKALTKMSLYSLRKSF